jgi:uncharacterized protein (TIGR02246 family)
MEIHRHFRVCWALRGAWIGQGLRRPRVRRRGSAMDGEQATGAGADTDESAVRGLYEELMDGWNRGSAEAFAAPFCADGDLVGFDGTHLRGREEIVAFHRPLFDKWLKGTRLVGRVESLRFVARDVALMHALGGTVMRGRSEAAPERDSVQTLVAVRRDGEWRLAAFQNTRVRPMGRSAGGTFVWLLSDRLWRALGPRR